MINRFEVEDKRIEEVIPALIQQDLKLHYNIASSTKGPERDDQLRALVAILKDCTGSASDLKQTLCSQNEALKVKFDYIKKFLRRLRNQKGKDDIYTQTVTYLNTTADYIEQQLLSSASEFKFQAPPVQIIITSPASPPAFTFYDYLIWDLIFHSHDQSASTSSSRSVTTYVAPATPKDPGKAKSSKNKDEDDGAGIVITGLVIVGFIIAAFAAVIAACYAIPKTFKSVVNIATGNKVGRSIWRLGATAGGGYGGAILGASIGSAFPILGTVLGGLIGAAVGSVFAKYSARGISAIFYSDAVNPTNPEKYELTETERTDLITKGYDMEVIKAILIAIRAEKKEHKGLSSSIPCTAESETREALNNLLSDIKSGKFTGFIKIGKQTFHPRRVDLPSTHSFAQEAMLATSGKAASRPPAFAPAVDVVVAVPVVVTVPVVVARSQPAPSAPETALDDGGLRFTSAM